jgi:aspartyl-tRNA(Asn)/glutamyl-tRNA(Gln) amidotransferase subunit B
MQLQSEISELPMDKSKRFQKEYTLQKNLSDQIAYEKNLAIYFEAVFSELLGWLETLPEFDGMSQEEISQKNNKKLSKLVGSWLLRIPFDTEKITPENFAEFLSLIYLAKVNSSSAQIVLSEMIKTGADPSHVMEEKNLVQIQDVAELDWLIEKLISDYPEQVKQFREGKKNVIMFLVGNIMKQTKGKADPKKVQELLKAKL